MTRLAGLDAHHLRFAGSGQEESADCAFLAGRGHPLAHGYRAAREYFDTLPWRASPVARLAQAVEDLHGRQILLLIEDLANPLLVGAGSAGTTDAPALRFSGIVERLNRRLLRDAGDRALGDARLASHLAVAQAGPEQNLDFVTLDHRDHLSPPPVTGEAPQPNPRLSLGQRW